MKEHLLLTTMYHKNNPTVNSNSMQDVSKYAKKFSDGTRPGLVWDDNARSFIIDEIETRFAIRSAYIGAMEEVQAKKRAPTESYARTLIEMGETPEDAVKYATMLNQVANGTQLSDSDFNRLTSSQNAVTLLSEIIDAKRNGQNFASGGVLAKNDIDSSSAYQIGESGQRAFANIQSNSNVDVTQDFTSFYEAGRAGLKFEQASGLIRNTTLSEAQAMQAFYAGQNDANANVRYAIKRTTKNKSVVVINDDILSGKPESDWIKTVKQTISAFSPEIPISGKLIKVNQTTKREYTKSKYTQHLQKTNQVVYKDKFNAAGHLDEILLASTNYINEDLNHSRSDNIKEFARGEVLLQIGKNKYTAKVIVGFTTGNNMVLYDIVDMTPSNFDVRLNIKNVDTDNIGKTSKMYPDRNTVSTSDNNVSQNEPVVNSQSMQDISKYAKEFSDGTRPGLVWDDNARRYLNIDASKARDINALAKALGAKVVIDPTLEADENGKIVNDVIHINPEADVWTVGLHEWIHRFKDTSPKQYNQLVKLVRENYTKAQWEQAIKDKITEYAKKENLTRERAIEELTASYVEKNLYNQSFIESLLEPKNRSVGQMILDWLKDMISRLTGNKTQLQRVADILEKGIKKADTTVKADANVRYDTKLDFKHQVDLAIDNKLGRGLSVHVGKLPAFYGKFGLDVNRVMLMNQSHLRDINHDKVNGDTRYHGINRDLIKQIPKLLNDAVIVFDSISPENKDNTICVVTKELDSDGYPIIIVIESSNAGNSFLSVTTSQKMWTEESNHINSVYGKEGFYYYLDEIIDKDCVLFADKNNVEKLFNNEKAIWFKNKSTQKTNTDVKLQLLERLDALGYNRILHQSRNIVNKKINRNSITNGETERYNLTKADNVSEITNVDDDMLNNIDSSSKNANFDISDQTRIAELEKTVAELQEALKQYGAIPKGETPVRDVDVPKQMNDDTKVRQFARTAAEAVDDNTLPTLESVDIK